MYMYILSFMHTHTCKYTHTHICRLKMQMDYWAINLYNGACRNRALALPVKRLSGRMAQFARVSTCSDIHTLFTCMQQFCSPVAKVQLFFCLLLSIPTKPYTLRTCTCIHVHVLLHTCTYMHTCIFMCTLYVQYCLGELVQFV